MSERCKGSTEWGHDENIGAGLNSYFGFENVRFHVLAKIKDDQLNQFDPAATVPLLACFNWRSIDRIQETSFFALLNVEIG